MLKSRFRQSPDFRELQLISRRCIEQREELTEQRERLVEQRARQREFNMKRLRRLLTDKSVAPALKLKTLRAVVWSVPISQSAHRRGFLARLVSFP